VTPPVPFLNALAETIWSEIVANATYRVNGPALLTFVQGSPSFKSWSKVKPYQSWHLTVPWMAAPFFNKYLSTLTDSQLQVLNQEYTARLSKTTQVLLSWCVFQRWDPELSISTSSIIISGSTSDLALLRYFLFLPQNSLLIYSPSHLHSTPFSSSGRLCCTVSKFTCFINSYWMRECDITVNLYVLWHHPIKITQHLTRGTNIPWNQSDFQSYSILSRSVMIEARFLHKSFTWSQNHFSI
jgi:hypothetical protein